MPSINPGGFRLLLTTVAAALLFSTLAFAQGDFAVNPGSLDFNCFLPTDAGSSDSCDFTQQAITVTATSGSVQFTAAATEANTPPGVTWLTVTPTSGSADDITGATLTVTVQPAGLAPFTYTGTITVTVNGVSQEVAITLFVGGFDTLMVTPTPRLNFPAQSGGMLTTATMEPFSLSTFVAPGTFAASLTIIVEPNAPWIAVSSPGATCSNTTCQVMATQSGIPVNVSINPVVMAPNNYTGKISLLDTSGNTTLYDIGLNLSAPVIVSPTSLQPATQGAPYGPITFTAAGGLGPYTWSASGLPSALTLSAGGTLSGTPASNTPANFNVMVRDSAGNTAPASYTLTIASGQLTVTTTSPPNGTVGQSYGPYVLSASGGTAPYTWSLASGSNLPTGLELSGDTLSGKPSAACTCTFSVSVTDSSKPEITKTVSFTVTIAAQGIGTASTALPHFAVGGVWTTGIFVINTGSQQANFSIAFHDDDGVPVALPFSSGSTNTLAGTVPANGSVYYEASDPAETTILSGSGSITADPGIVVQGLFRADESGTYYEAGVPSMAGTKEFLIPFYATTFAPTGAPFYTGFAIANLDQSPATVTCTTRTGAGVVIAGGVTVPALDPLGHWANYLFPALAGNRGTIDCLSNTNIAATALRFIGNDAFSSLPVITNSSGLPTSSTMTLPHFAVGGVWTTGIFVINTGSQQANFSIAFHDDHGVPVTLPFTSGSTNTLASTVPANGSIYYEASDSGETTILSGSGTITADPNIVIQGLFRADESGTYYEAGVPSMAGTKEFLIPFDATTFAPTGAPFYTGFAIANLDQSTATVACTARTAGGVVITDGVTVPALDPLGHWANYLFPALAGNRGTIDCLSNTNIAATALRFIGNDAFSSLPVVVEAGSAH